MCNAHCASFYLDSMLEIESSWSNERLSLSCSPSCSGRSQAGWIRWATPIWLTGPRWDKLGANGAQMGPCVQVQPDGGNHLPFCCLAICLAIIPLPGKKAFPFIALGSPSLPLWPQVLFRRLQNGGGEYIGRLSDRPFVSEPAKRFARNYHPIRDIQVLINSLLSRQLEWWWWGQSGKRPKMRTNAATLETTQM